MFKCSGANVLTCGRADVRRCSCVQVAGAGEVLVPNFRGMTMNAVLAAAAAKQLQVAPSGSGVAKSQAPAAGAVVHLGERIRVEFSR